VDISIIEEFISNKQHMIIKNSKEEDKFVIDLIKSIKKMDTEHISNKELLVEVVQEFSNKSDIL